MDITIRQYGAEDQAQVIELWRDTIADSAPHNDPAVAIRMKLTKDPELFLVAAADEKIVGTVIGGFDGHRGWLYSLAVAPQYGRRGIATALVKSLEVTLAKMGCLKLNLQVRSANSEAIAFYEHTGYSVEDRVSLGKRLYDGTATGS